MKYKLFILIGLIFALACSRDSSSPLNGNEKNETHPPNINAQVLDNGENIKGLNWADARDNFVDGWVIPSPLWSSASYSEVQSVANNIYTGFQNDGANTVRLPINPPSVLESWWDSYKGAIDEARNNGMNVILACWDSDSERDGLIDDMDQFWSMWDGVINDYGDNSGVFFEVFNEPHGYSKSELVSIYNEFLDRYSNIPRDRILLGGTGYSGYVSEIGGSFPNCLLSQHLYAWWGEYTTISEWEDELSERIGGYESRTVITEFGAPMTTGKDYTGPIDGDYEIAYIQGLTKYSHDNNMSTVYWPGVRSEDSYRMYTYNDGAMDITNSSGLERVQYSWSSGDDGLSGEYRIVNRNSDKCLIPYNGSGNDGTEVVQYTVENQDYEVWNITENSSGSYNIVHVSSGNYADIEGASTEEGANNIIWPSNGGDNQKWNIIDQGDGYYHIENVNSGLLLDIEGASTSNNANNIQWSDNGGHNQDWYFEEAN